MIKNVLKLVLIIMLNNFITTKLKSQILFQKEYSSGIHSMFVLDTLSDGYLIAGSTLTNTTGGIDGFAMKTDLTGNVIWSKNYGGTEDDQFFTMCKTSNGNFILAGKTESFVNNLSDVSNCYLIEIDTAGNLIRSKSIGTEYNDIAYSILETVDNGIVIAGSSDSLGTVQPLLIKTDNLFNISWSHIYNTVAYDVNCIKSIIQTNDNGFAFTGFSTLSSGVIDTNLFIVKTNSLGIPTFSTHYFFNDFANYTERGAYGYDIIQNDSGDLVVVGATGGLYQSIFRPYAPMILSVDLSGNIISSKNIYLNTGDSRALSIQQTTDDGYIIGGYLGNYYMSMIKLKNLNEIDWNYHYSYNFNPPSKGYCANTTRDNGYILVGSLMSGESIRIVKTDESGISGCDQGIPSMQNLSNVDLTYQSLSWSSIDNVDTAESISSTNTFSLIANVICFNDLTEIDDLSKKNEKISIYPNPAEELLYIDSENRKIETLIITNILGDIIYKNAHPSTEIILNISSLPSGVYFVITENEQIKFMKN